MTPLTLADRGELIFARDDSWSGALLKRDPEDEM
jgi:hypothetical protein